MASDQLVAIGVSILSSLILAVLLHRFRILGIVYYSKGDETEEYFQKNKLRNFGKQYRALLYLLFPVGLFWAFIGLSLTIIFTNFSDFGLSTTNSIELGLWIWLVVTLVLLVSLPLLVLSGYIQLPSALQSILARRELIILNSIVFIGFVISVIHYGLEIESAIILLLLAIPAVFSAWFAGEFYAIFLIRQWFTFRGWDYIEGKRIENTIGGRLKRGIALSNMLSLSLAPILAVNSLISLFLPQDIREDGGLIGYATDPILPPWLQNILVFVLILGPLLTLALQPSGFLSLLVNSNVFHTLSTFDWEEFNRRSSKMEDIIGLKPHTQRTMGGILAVFMSFAIYVTILAMGGLLSTLNNTSIPLQDLNNPVKFIEVPVLLYVLFKILRDLSQEREVVDIANLGRKESRDMTGWTFYVLQNLYDNNYDLLNTNLEELLVNETASRNHRVHFYKGLMIALQGDNISSELYFRQSVELNPKYADGWFELGTVQYFQERYDNALENLFKAQKLKPYNKTIFYNIGRVYDRLKSPQTAIEYYKKAARIDSTDPKIWSNMIGPYIQLKEYETAMKIGNKAMDMDPDDFITKTNMVTLYQELGMDDEHDAMIKEMVDAQIENVNVLSTMATNLSISGMHEDATKFFDQLIILEAIRPDNISGFSNTYMQQNRYQELHEILVKHVEKYPNDNHAKFLLGQVYVNVQQYEQAVPLLQQYLDEGGEIIVSHTKLTAALANLGRFEEAKEVLERGLSKDPNDADMNFNMGLTRSLLGLEDFDSYFSKSLEKTYNDHFFNIWIQSRMKVGTLTKDWIASMQDRFEKDLSSARVLYMIGNAARIQGDNDKAKSYFDESLQYNPDPSTITEIANQLLNIGNFEEAITLYKQVTVSQPNVFVFNNLGVAYLRLNEIEQALNAFLAGASKYSEDTLIRENITKIYTSQKEYTLAIPYYEELLKLDSSNYVYIYEYATCLALTNQVEVAKQKYDTARDLAIAANDEAMITKIDEMLSHLTSSEQ